MQQIPQQKRRSSGASLQSGQSFDDSEDGASVPAAVLAPASAPAPVAAAAASTVGISKKSHKGGRRKSSRRSSRISVDDWQDDFLKEGAVVTIVLEGRPDLDGKKGTVANYDASSDRWNVYLGDDKGVALKAHNLKRMHEEPVAPTSKMTAPQLRHQPSLEHLTVSTVDEPEKEDVSIELDAKFKHQFDIITQALEENHRRTLELVRQRLVSLCSIRDNSPQEAAVSKSSLNAFQTADNDWEADDWNSEYEFDINQQTDVKQQAEIQDASAEAKAQTKDTKAEGTQAVDVSNAEPIETATKSSANKCGKVRVANMFSLHDEAMATQADGASEHSYDDNDFDEKSLPIRIPTCSHSKGVEGMVKTISQQAKYDAAKEKWSKCAPGRLGKGLSEPSGVFNAHNGTVDLKGKKKKSRLSGSGDSDSDEEKEKNNGLNAVMGLFNNSRKKVYKEKRRKDLFANADLLKQELLEKYLKKGVDIASFYHETGWAAHIAKHNWFQNVTVFVIVSNALWIAIETDLNKSDVLAHADIGFQVVEHVFCGFFLVEWLVRLVALKSKCRGWSDKWFAFDFIMVLFMVFETWVLTILVMMAQSDGTATDGSNLGDASILKGFKLLRLARLARMAKLFRLMPELIILAKAMGTAFRSVFFTLCLLLLVVYVFAIAFRQLTNGTEVGGEYFAAVPSSMVNLFILGIFPDHFDWVFGVAGEDNFIWGCLLVLFIFFAEVTIMGMLAGVLVEVVSVTSEVEREKMTVAYVTGHFKNILPQVDNDGNLELTREEFHEFCLNDAAVKVMVAVGVDVLGLVEFGDFIFGDLDTITFENFMKLVLQLRGQNAATVKDVVDMRKFVWQSLTALHGQVKYIHDRIDQMGSATVSIHKHLSRQTQMVKTMGKEQTLRLKASPYH